MRHEPRSDLQGELALLGPELVLQMLGQARADGVLHFAAPQGSCWVAFRGGRIAGAGTGELAQLENASRRRPGARARPPGAAARSDAPRSGRDPRASRGSRQSRGGDLGARTRAAIQTALGWREGRFSFQRGPTPHEEDLLLDVEGLLLDCMTSLDRMRSGRDGAQGA